MYNGYVQLNYINQLYSDGDLWLANAQQNSSGGDTKNISTANALGTDIAGNNLYLKAGTSTGNAASGDIAFYTGTQGSTSGTATNTAQERLLIRGTDGAVEINRAYALPTADGTSGQRFSTDGNGTITFVSTIDEVVDDTTPTLGGNLDADGYDITGLDKLGIGDATNSSTERMAIEHDGTANTVFITPDSATDVAVKLSTSHNFSVVDTGGNNRLQVSHGGGVTVNNAYTLPTTDGTAGQYLVTDGSGAISFTTAPSGLTYSDFSAGGDLSYDNTTGTFSYTERTDTEIRQLIGVSGDLSYDSGTGTIGFVERTDGEVRGLLSATGDISYNSTTGEFSFNNSSGYLTSASITETDTLDSVTGRGSTTTNTIQVGGLTVTGNLTVEGTTTFIESNTLNIGDNLITLNADIDAQTAPTEDAGIEVKRGTGATVALRWDESAGKWTYTNDGSNYNAFPVNVSDLTNDSSFISLTDLSASGDISYNSGTGEFTFNNTSGYITAETDTLATVTARGATTSDAITLNNSLTIQNEIYTQGVALKYQNAVDQPQIEVNSDNITIDNAELFVNGNITLGDAALTQAGNQDRTIKPPTSDGTNIVGSDLTIETGASTGNAASGSFVIKTGTQGAASNAVVNTTAERLKVSGVDGKITFNTAYSFPTSDGVNGTYLGTDGSGNLTFKQVNYTDLDNLPNLSTVALSGDYGDLINTPTNVSTFVNDAGYYTDGAQMVGDLQGSVFGDDSTTLVDSVNNTINTHALLRVGANDAQALVWDDANNRWQPGTIDGANVSIILDQIGDIDTTGKQTGDYLQWNGSQWVPIAASAASGISQAEAEELAFIGALLLG